MPAHRCSEGRISTILDVQGLRIDFDIARAAACVAFAASFISTVPPTATAEPARELRGHAQRVRCSGRCGPAAGHWIQQWARVQLLGVRNHRKSVTVDTRKFTHQRDFALACTGRGLLTSSEVVTPEGIGPSSPRLADRCFIQLSYGTTLRRQGLRVPGAFLSVVSLQTCPYSRAVLI